MNFIRINFASCDYKPLLSDGSCFLIQKEDFGGWDHFSDIGDVLGHYQGVTATDLMILIGLMVPLFMEVRSIHYPRLISLG